MKKYILFILAVGLHFTAIAQLNITFRSKLPFPGKDLSNIWGYAAGGKEYALVGHQQGMSVVEVTDPVSPVELFLAPGPNSIWREVRTKGNYAFVTTEGGGGLQIVNLSYLPDSIQYENWTGDGVISGQLSSIHALQVDGNFLYLYGSNLFGGAPLIIDVTDPWNPVYINKYTNLTSAYVHDGIVRNDTGYFGHIYGGFFSVVDITDKLNPVTLGTQNTPGNFTHNTWLSDNNNVLFTTDEVNNSFLTAYDVNNPGNIFELDRIQHNPGSNSVVHNTYVLNDYAVSSWYKEGVVIVDAWRPGNLIITGYYDTSPLSGAGMDGCWGVYAFLPSGNLLASDIQEGMYVLTPTYVRGCYLEGTVTDISTSNPINNATIEILTTPVTSNSNISGNYATGIITAGTYNIAFSAAGYISDTLSAILSNGVLTVLNAQLLSLNSFTVTGQVVKSGSGNPVANANVLIENSDFQFALTADAGGNFSIPTFFQGNYEVIAGKWNYITNCFNQVIDTASNSLLIELDSGIYDDFTFNFGWTVTGTAATGIWERGEPVGTDWISTGDANPGTDVSTDCSGSAYVTGNGGGSAGTDDVDDGNTVITSPVFDLSSSCSPFLNYYRWFFNDGGAGTPNDTLHVSITNGTTTVTIESVDVSSAGNSSWVPRSFKVADYITPTATMQVIFKTSDLPGSGHLVEAGVDKFEIIDSAITVDSTSTVLASCGVADGSITVYADGCALPLQFSIDTGTTFQPGNTFNNLAAGFYSIIIMDSVNYTTTIPVVLGNINAPVIVIDSAINASCNGLSDGSIAVSSSGGAPPYQYNIDVGPFQADSSFTGLTPGTYLITVKDANGCISSISQAITEPALLAGNLSSTNESSTGASDGTASVSMSGGTMPYNYSWSPGSQITASITGLTSGVYTVTVNDSNGCAFIDSIFVGTAINSIDEFAGENVNIKAFPNPSDGSVLIEYKLDDALSPSAKMLISDLSGRSVIEIELTSQQGIVVIDEEISEGVYFVRIINSKNISRTVKLVKF